MLLAATFAVGPVRANELSMGFGSDYAVLFEGEGTGNTRQIGLSANFGNQVKLAGLDTNQLFNFVGGDDFLNPNEPISVSDVDGRAFDGNSHDMPIGDDDTKHAPLATPEPATLALLGTGMVALGTVARRRRTLAS
jgi:PEP-CTERM motif